MSSNSARAFPPLCYWRGKPCPPARAEVSRQPAAGRERAIRRGHCNREGAPAFAIALCAAGRTPFRRYKDLNYDRYRAIRFKKNLALWKHDNLGFTAELFSAGYIYLTPVQIFVVDGGQAAEMKYDPDLFTYGPEVSRPPEDTSPGFSGFRMHTPIDRPDVMDEFAVFQGASYFRVKATGQDYGMSARGLAINTAQPPADEFPIFRSFWLVKPAPGAATVTVFALLDSISVSGAYKFVISAGQNTVMDVDCTLFPRNTMTYAGIAPLTSMFYFAPGNGYRADDARRACTIPMAFRS